MSATPFGLAIVCPLPERLFNTGKSVFQQEFSPERGARGGKVDTVPLPQTKAFNALKTFHLIDGVELHVSLVVPVRHLSLPERHNFWNVLGEAEAYFSFKLPRTREWWLIQ